MSEAIKSGEKVEFVALDKKELQSMLTEAALKGASMACENMEKRHMEKLKKEKDRRIHNTDLLLKQYKTLRSGCKNAVYKKTGKVKVDDMIGEIMELDDDSVIVESIKRSAERTEIMLSHIDKMLEVFRIYCSKYGEKERREYKVIKALYISKQSQTIKELAKEYKVSEVTIYADLKSAKEKLSALFFGINGLKFY